MLKKVFHIICLLLLLQINNKAFNLKSILNVSTCLLRKLHSASNNKGSIVPLLYVDRKQCSKQRAANIV